LNLSDNFSFQAIASERSGTDPSLIPLEINHFDIAGWHGFFKHKDCK